MATNKRERRGIRRDNLVAAGLLLPPEVTYPPGQSGKRAIWPADTEAREAAIKHYLDNGWGYQLAANELILMGYDPAKPILARNFLAGYARAQAGFTLPALQRERLAPEEKTPAQQHAAIRRRATALAKVIGSNTYTDFSTSDQLGLADALYWLATSAQGVAPQAIRKIDLPDLAALVNWKRRADQLANPAIISEQRILWALAEGRTNLARLAPHLSAFLVSNTGLLEPEWVRTFCAGHYHCPAQHTLAQAMLPGLAAYLATDPDVLTRGMPPIERYLMGAFEEIGGLLAGTWGS